jgi:hypothetical protein
MLNHVPNLPLHGDEEQHDPVNEQYGPEHRHVEDGEKRHAEGDHKRLCA